MSDAKDAIDEARIKIKRLAASMLARKDSLEKERSAAQDGSERAAQLDEAIATADQDYRDALSEMLELAKLAKETERAEQRALIDGGSTDRSAADIALENVRDHIGQLEARAELEEELAGKTPARAAREARPTTSPEERAKEQLEALKAERKAKGDAGEKDEGGSSNKGPKRTM
jgi:hypothetical protein